jgi:hypothetical protein
MLDSLSHLLSASESLTSDHQNCVIASRFSSWHNFFSCYFNHLTHSVTITHSLTLCLLKSADRLVESTALNDRLQLNVWVFGIAYLNIAFSQMALTQFCLHVLYMWKGSDDDQVDARLPQDFRRLPQNLRVFKVQQLAEREVSVVHGMLQLSHPEHLGTA